MLPKSRIFANLLVGLSCALMVGAGLTLRWVETEPVFPLDVSETTFVLEDATASYIDPATGYNRTGPLRKQLHYTVVEPYDAEVASLRVGYSLLASANTPLTPVPETAEAAEAEEQTAVQSGILSYTFDRTTGEIVSDLRVSDQLALPAQDVVVNGVWLKFPVGAGETDYEVFDITSRSMVTAEYQDTEQRDGREIRHYRQSINPVNLAEQYVGHANSITVPGGDEENPVELTANLYHMGSRDWFVDAETGMVINVAESITDFYAVDPSAPLVRSLNFNGEFDAELQQTLLDQAAVIAQPNQTWEIARIVLIAGIALFVLTFPAALGWYPRQRRAAKAKVNSTPKNYE